MRQYKRYRYAMGSIYRNCDSVLYDVKRKMGGFIREDSIATMKICDLTSKIVKSLIEIAVHKYVEDYQQMHKWNSAKECR